MDRLRPSTGWALQTTAKGQHSNNRYHLPFLLALPNRQSWLPHPLLPQAAVAAAAVAAARCLTVTMMAIQLPEAQPRALWTSIPILPAVVHHRKTYQATASPANQSRPLSHLRNGAGEVHLSPFQARHRPASSGQMTSSHVYASRARRARSPTLPLAPHPLSSPYNA